MTSYIRLSYFFVAWLLIVARAWAGGSWDSYSPQSTPQGGNIYLNGWGYVNGLGDVKANIYVDGNIVGQASMTDWRGDIAGGGYWGWHFNLNTSSLSVGAHSISIWIGSNSQGQWQYFSQSYVEQTGAVTLTVPNYNQAIRFNSISTKSVTQSVLLNGSGLDQPYYRATYGDLNNAFGGNVGQYWDHWFYNGFNEWRSPYSGATWEGSAYSQSGLPIGFGVVSGPAYISGGRVYFNGSGQVTLRATQGGGSANGRNFNPVSTDISFWVSNSAPTVGWNALPTGAIYVNDNFTARATGSDSDGNLSSVTVQYRVNGQAWQTLASNGGNGWAVTSDGNTIVAGLPNTKYQFQANATDALGGSSGWIVSGEYTVANRAPYSPAISAGGTGVTYNAQNQCYEMWVGTPITITAQVSDWDSDLVAHSIWRITSPTDNTWLLINNGAGGAPTNSASGNSSSKTVTYMPQIPGRYDFHTNGQDTLGATSGGASITVYVYGPTNNALFLSQTVHGQANPTAVTLNQGQTFNVSISMRNSGDKPWTTDATPHGLGVVGDVSTWGLTRVALPVSPVNPTPQSGSDVTFNFTATAPSSPGVYTFQWRMVEDGVQWFGPATGAVQISVQAPPVITAQPQSQTVNAGSNVTFSVTTTGLPAPTYQWRKNGTTIAGATSSTLSLTNAQASDAATYSVVATNSLGSATSSGASLTVNTAPVFSSHPQSQIINAGGTVSFTAAASGIPTPTYQWRINGANIAGATSATFSKAGVQPGDAGTYTVVASNSVSSVTSNAATLTVYTAPVITAQPQSVSANVGTSASFSVAANGNPSPSYQWRKNGTNIPGATSATLALNNVQPADAANYSVVVTNSVSSVASANATLTVVTIQPDTTNQNQLNLHLPLSP